MNSKELVKRTMRGDYLGRTPIYAWVELELKKEITAEFGSVANFEDKYEFDLAHIFGGPYAYSDEVIAMKKSGVEITPEILLQFPLLEINREENYRDVIESLKHHNQRDRFCYVQTPGIFEALNDVFGIENHLLYMALYEDELKEVYKRQTRWNIENAKNLIDLKVDGIHISDDWGSQRSLMFSPKMLEELIIPCHREMLSDYKKADVLVSLHSDGCVVPALDMIADIGYDFIHPWQESSGMPYDLYLHKYQNRFGILGGVCVQTTLGYGNIKRVEDEITRIFHILKGKRWACCTTHFVENSCSMEELTFAYDLINKLKV